MNNFTDFIRRVFRRKPKSAPRFDYLPETSLPTDATTLIRAGVITEWRTNYLGEVWYRADAGALAWWQKNLGGEK